MLSQAFDESHLQNLYRNNLYLLALENIKVPRFKIFIFAE